jgi:hypothetical protein
MRFGRVAVTEVGVGKENVTEDYRRRYLQGVVGSLRRMGAWMTVLYSLDDPAWSLPAGLDLRPGGHRKAPLSSSWRSRSWGIASRR